MSIRTLRVSSALIAYCLAGGALAQSDGSKTSAPKLDLASIWLHANAGTVAAGSASGLAIGSASGGTLRWKLGSLSLRGGLSDENVTRGQIPLGRPDYSWHALAGFGAGSLDLALGFGRVPLYASGGADPADLRGPEANLSFKLSNNLNLNASGAWYTNLGGGSGAAQLMPGDKVYRYGASLGYRLNRAWQFSFGAEVLNMDSGSPFGTAELFSGRPLGRWYNVGLDYNLSSIAKLNFLWQISDLGNGATPLSFNPNPTGVHSSGNLISTQLTIKF